jgi:hypothetical protein
MAGAHNAPVLSPSCSVIVMKALPDDDKLDIAIQWLLSNEGANGEEDACMAVAAWLESHQTKRKLRRAAYKAGIPFAVLRRRLELAYGKLR